MNRRSGLVVLSAILAMSAPLPSMAQSSAGKARGSNVNSRLYNVGVQNRYSTQGMGADALILGTTRQGSQHPGVSVPVGVGIPIPIGPSR